MWDNLCQNDYDACIGAGGGGGPYTMVWSDNFGISYGGVITGTDGEITVSPDTTTTYYFTLDDQCSMDYIDSLTITVYDHPTLSAEFVGLTEGCPDLTVSVEAQSEPNNTYLFDFECDGSIDQQSVSNISSYNFSESGYQDVCIEVVTENGCTNNLVFDDSIFVYPTPYADFSPNVDQTTLLNPTIIFNNGSVGGTTYTWDFGDGTIISGPVGGVIADSIPGDGTFANPNYTYSDTGTFIITLTVTNEYGCSDVTQEEILVTGYFVLFAPTAFTPNGGGFNYTFFPQGLGLESVSEFEMYIFNRWGEQIFESQNYQDQWDGTYRGQVVQDGVYEWYIRIVDRTEVSRYYGHVTKIE